MGKKLTKLTKEQEALLPVMREKWLKIGLATGPGDVERAKAGVCAAYKVAGLEPPTCWIVLPSPLHGTIGSWIFTQVRGQVRGQVWDQVWDQVWATSYWGVKITLGLPIDHWFFDFLKLGVMIVFVTGKVKVFGKKGKYLGEYDESELI